jgi:3-deoxy-D-manno-octulosonic acid kinase
MPSDAAPQPRFESLHVPGARLVVDASWSGAAEARALLDPAALARALAATTGAQGRAATALYAPGDGSRVLLRPVRHGGLLAPLWGAHRLGLGRPLRELRVCAALRARGAPVPRALFVVGHRRGLLWSAVLGTSYESGARDGLSLLASRPEQRALAAATRAAARAVRRFHDAGGRHADLHLGNLLIREEGGVFDALVIDLDRGDVGAPPRAPRRMRELMRLYRSILKRGFEARVGLRGCARFLHAYCDGDRRLRSALLAELPREMRRITRHRWSWSVQGGRPKSADAQ